jgi:hypothetical protein
MSEKNLKLPDLYLFLTGIFFYGIILASFPAGDKIDRIAWGFRTKSATHSD